jgi:thiol-disulfide isomerase/thioredoxin
MKKGFLSILAIVAALCSARPVVGAEATAAATELKALVSKVQDKLHAGKRSEADLAGELKEFDSLIDKHKSEKTDDTAQIVLMKAMLYLEVLGNTDKGVELVQQLKRDYPDTEAGKNADAIIDNIKQQEAGKKIQRTLVEGAKFPDFEEKDLEDKPLSIANYKGKVVLIDFWATWCGPCVGELPNVIKAYEKHHDQGFEIIGVNLDQDAKKLKAYTKEKNMPWQQFCDGKRWESKLAQRYGIQSIPATFLLDGEGKIIARDLRGDDMEQALTKALAKK